MNTRTLEPEARTFGPEGFSPEDAAHQGSTFQEVRDAVFANPYHGVWAGPGRLPRYRVTLGSVLAGLLTPGGAPFFQAASRTIDSSADLRWGLDGRGYRRLLHPNGVCLTGVWEATEETGHTGYFERGRRGLVIARYSTCCTETRRGHYRSLSMVGKLYPTEDRGSAARVRPAAFITQQDLGGERTDYVNDARRSCRGRCAARRR